VKVRHEMLLLRRRWGVEALIDWLAQLTGELLIELSWIAPHDRLGGLSSSCVYAHHALLLTLTIRGGVRVYSLFVDPPSIMASAC
jgi:hypothetical protein